MRRSTLFGCVLWIAATLPGCGGAERPAEAGPAPAVTAEGPPSPGEATPKTETPAPAGDLLSQLKSSKLSLAQGVQQAEKDNGPAISAKFELEEGRLSLSVYTAKAGFDTDAEHNVLMELSGDPTTAKWEAKSQVFEDKAHITRAAMHLTLLQRAKTTLSAVIAKASAKQPGTVYSVTPAVKDKKPVFQVQVATPDGKSVTLAIDAG